MSVLISHRSCTIAASFGLGLTVVMASCQAPQSAREPVVEVREIDDEARSDEPEPIEPVNELAALAERDVEAFLNRRRAGGEPSHQIADDSRSMEILWNDSPRRPARTNGQDDDVSAEVVVLARERDELPPVIGPVTTKQADDEEATALDGDRLRELIVDLSKELYQEASYADMPLRELLLIAATTLVSPERALSPDAIPGLTERERELLSRFQSFFTELGNGLDGSRSADDVIVASLESLRRSLSTEPRLELGTLALCRRVGGFGDYDAFSKNAFLGHAEQQAIVYIEIAGFTSETNAKGEWVTELSQQLVIYSERDGIPVWREDWQSAVDVSKNKRNDFFVVQIITFPKALSVGKYYLKVRVRDEKSRAEAEGSIPFEMVADPRMSR